MNVLTCVHLFYSSIISGFNQILFDLSVQLKIIYPLKVASCSALATFHKKE